MRDIIIKKGIFTKVFSLVILTSILAGGLFLIIITIWQTRVMEGSLVEENKIFAGIAAKSIEAGHLSHYWPFETLKKIADSEKVVFLWIVKPTGEIFLADNPEMHGKIIEDSFLGSEKIIIRNDSYNNDDIKLISYPLRIETSGQLWNLYLGVSLDSVKAAKRRTISLSIAVFILVIVFTSFIAFYFSKTVIQPLEQLEEGAGIIGRGNLDYRIKIKTGDEIEELADSFNQMAENLEKSKEALEKEKASLEIKVAERTKDLEEERVDLDRKVRVRTSELEAEKNKTLSVITNLIDGLLVFDKDNKLILINPQAEELLNVEAEQVLGKSALELGVFPNIEPLVSFLDVGFKRTFRKELVLKENLVLEVSTIPMTYHEEDIGSMVVLHDISREKLIERMKTEFVTVAAHQLRTPLSAIKWTLKMLLDEDLGKITKKQKEFLKKTYISNERMISLINDLLNVTRIEEGRYLYKLNLSDFSRLVEEVIESFKERIDNKKIKFEFIRPKEKLPKVMLDTEKMRLAISNLLDNSVKYTPQNGKVTISLKYDTNKKEVEFSIRDTGVGISKKQEDRVFDKFFRGGNVIRMETEGTGLGLFIAKNIVEAHKGRIWFESEVEKGTTFYITLPVKKKFSEFLTEKFY